MNVHIILISSEISNETKYELNGIKKPRENPYFYWQSEAKSITISVMRWAQVIELNKRKLSYLSTKLKIKDVNIDEKINADFSEIGFDKVRSVLRKVPIPQ